MPDKYEGLYVTNYGTSTPTPTGNYTASEWTTYSEATTGIEYDPTELVAYVDNLNNDIELIWGAPSMIGATFVAGFRRSGTDTTSFTPSPATEHFRVPVATTYYIDQNVPAGNYVYQVFPLVES